RIRGCKRQSEIQLPRHHVIAELVDVANDVGKRRGFPGAEPTRLLGDCSIAYAATERSSEVAPKLAEQRQQILITVEQAEVALLFTAAVRKYTSEGQACLREICGWLFGPGVARRRTERKLVHDADLRQFRRGDDAHTAGLLYRYELEANRLIVDEQRVRPHVGRAGGIVVEAAGIDLIQREQAAIENQVASDLAHAACAQIAQK